MYCRGLLSVTFTAKPTFNAYTKRLLLYLAKYLEDSSYIEVDVVDLELGTSIHMSELQLPEKLTIPVLAQGADYDQVVVACNVPRRSEELELAAKEIDAGAEEGTEGEPKGSDASGEADIESE